MDRVADVAVIAVREQDNGRRLHTLDHLKV
jgi:hypothetical protein